MKIILIAGHAANGKDYSANIIKNELEKSNQKVLVIHYADFLKSFCKDCLGWDGQKDETGRTLLQYWGTNVVRKNNPDAWVSMMSQLFTGIQSEFDYAIIPDCRFQNEITRWYSYGCVPFTVRVTRLNFVSPLTAEQQNHPSETNLDDWLFDYQLLNDGTPEGLYKEIKKCLDTMKDMKFIQ